MVDGASRFGSSGRSCSRCARPALVTVALLAFVTSWNQYLLPLLVFTTTSHFTLPLGRCHLPVEYSPNTGAILAFTALAAIPALAVFVFAERYLVAGATGAVKG